MSMDDWLNRFPEKRRKVLLSGLSDAQDVYYFTERKYLIHTAFIKREKLIKVDYAGNIEPYTPRLINTMHPVLQLRTGPIIYSLSLWLEHVFNHNCRFFMAPSNNSDVIGDWFHSHTTPTSYFYCCDFSLYDCSQPKASFEQEWKNMSDAGMDPHSHSMLVQSHLPLRTYVGRVNPTYCEVPPQQ